MTRVHRLDAQGLPPDQLDLRLAHRFLGLDNPLQASILRHLIGRPRHYSEFKNLLRGRSEGNLTHALRVLMDEDVIAQHVDASQQPPAKLYELTELGVDVVRTIERLRVIEAASRAADDVPGAAHAG